MLKPRSAAVAALCGIGSVLWSLLVPVTPALAHGSMSNPTSRIYNCWRENPETPKSAACKAAVAVGDSWVVYDWDEVNLPNANGKHRQLIPDGKLCSAGRAKYQGFDLARADWVATKLPTGGAFTFRYAYTAAHPGLWELYVTRDGYDPTKLLRWSDLEPTPFYRQMNPPVSGGAYQLNAQIPAGKSGRHLIYAIWQRQLPDSAEAFYSCSDVIF
ncbi:lytic polysaccharide monooxygenase auxiliary activity family 9 protein [Kibdelosporangium phytohabitans]|uniref:Cell wall protein n=1 Tax=Kibdelosporangium phytohabitans TaxID=860235 RepID=A0A0N7F3T0_9PSEU|nr:lytic polysaccharide monooxygenase [Kibdelosporangium phytohabitans]ALG09487.1 cell wall protein [Kibdelosporangium phytohabitans]MBE1469213.1 chitin-binding protein [Kibdelosporangium phytohabitans]